jgi:uncharacterized membrane protein (DUF485 family)
MPHWDHSASEQVDDAPHVAARNARIGMWLFVVYTACYAAFVLTCVFSPGSMAARPWAGINLAIWSGFGLLLLALVTSLFYSWLCRTRGEQ